MKRTTKKGFTLVEILIVVIILGILAAIVIPQFSQASTEARISSLKTNLQTIRSQLLLYKMQHTGEVYPTDADLVQMTNCTDMAGTVLATAPTNVPTTACPLGPYLQTVPVNPITGLNTVRIAATFAGTEVDGWVLNSTTGEFRADLLNTRLAPDGVTLLNSL
ncbi:MAG: prepilin-type N-terminal cleavage/methylation domain-containing protein [Planctomycetota bacterium]|nr:prepilin-type N-terminal cleavage/methylation domain-containing protein [Planctomycetota bacterium]